MFLCDSCHDRADCLGLPSYGPCERCGTTGHTTDCHCNRARRGEGEKMEQKTDPFAKLAEDAATKRGVPPVIAQIRTLRERRKNLMGEIAQIDAELAAISKEIGVKPAKIRYVKPKAVGTSRRRGMPKKDEAPVVEG